nr:GntR family transcriptional regulator [Ruminococcus sp. OA3]
MKGRIKSGQLQQGKHLPSGRQLCKNYQVSIRTVSEVLNALKQDGFIRIEPRTAPLVCYEHPDRSSSAMIKSVLSQRDGILQIYQTMVLLIPPLIAFSAEGCAVKEQPHYRQLLKSGLLQPTISEWRTVSDLFKDVLCSSGNSLFGDVYAAFELYSQMSFFTEEQQAFTDISFSGLAPRMIPLINLLCTNDPDQIHGPFNQLYEDTARLTARCLKQLETRFPDCPKQDTPVFAWSALRGQDYYYTRIVRDLINKIGTGFYPANAYIPHEAELARQYGVSVFTIRKALTETARLGFSKTLNSRGTVALIPNDSVVFRPLQNQTSKRTTLLYLYALQFLVFAIRPAATCAAPHITPQDLEAVAHRFKEPDNIPLADILQLILDRLNLHPLKVILGELGNLSHFGFYFAFYRSKHDSTSLINEKSLRAFDCLHTGDVEGFANGLSECYSHILRVVRRFVIEKYSLYEAKYLRIPDISFITSLNDTIE